MSIAIEARIRTLEQIVSEMQAEIERMKAILADQKLPSVIHSSRKNGSALREASREAEKL